MRIFFDTEFYEDGERIKLISIGMVREDGATYYAETTHGAQIASITPWLKENVLPHLTHGDAVKDRATMQKEIVAFAGGSPQFWAYYADYDWVVLCQLFGTMMDLPQGWPMYCCDLKQRVDEQGGGVRLPKQEGAEHNALADAIWNRDSFEWLHRHLNGLPTPPPPA
jgi:hypothetical protein